MTTISELTAPQLARHATNMIIYRGRNETCARLIYHALVLDPNEAEALARLSDYLDQKGLEAFSATVLEYACSPERSISEEARTMLNEVRFRAIWGWSFSQHVDGQKFLKNGDFADRSKFVVDEEGYQDSLIKPLIKITGSLQNSVKSAHILIGVFGKLLVHRELGGKAPFEEVYRHPELFVRRSEYDEWLLSSTSEIDALELERNKHYKKPNIE